VFNNYYIEMTFEEGEKGNQTMEGRKAAGKIASSKA
jgi:hypothetical protein